MTFCVCGRLIGHTLTHTSGHRWNFIVLTVLHFLPGQKWKHHHSHQSAPVTLWFPLDTQASLQLHLHNMIYITYHLQIYIYINQVQPKKNRFYILDYFALKTLSWNSIIQLHGVIIVWDHQLCCSEVRLTAHHWSIIQLFFLIHLVWQSSLNRGK